MALCSKKRRTAIPGSTLKALLFAGIVLCTFTATSRAEELVQTVMANVEVTESGDLVEHRMCPGASYLIKPTFDRFVRFYDYPVPRDAEGNAVASPGKLMAVYRFVSNDDGSFNVYLDDQELKYRPDRGDQEPLLIKRKNPFYPRNALNANVEGWVLADFRIDKRGKVRDIEIASEFPIGVFGSTVKSALKGWRFEPILVDGEPAEVRDSQIFEFMLEDPE